MHRIAVASVVGVIAIASFPQMTRAVDGVIEINQAKALAGGVTSGDAPGFPVTISAPGSYRLTSNLDLSSESPDTTAIDEQADQTSIDLNGFQIIGPASCSDSGSCSNTGAGIGIYAATAHDVRIANGSVTAMGSIGVYISAGSIDHLLADHNGGDGVWIGIGSVSHVVARSNRFLGIVVNTKGSVIDSVATDNGTTGIGLTQGLASGCTSQDNGSDGIHVVTGSVDGSTANSNGAIGISVITGLIRGCAASSNLDAGFKVTDGSVLSSVGRLDGSNTIAEFVCSSACGYSQSFFTPCPSSDATKCVTGPAVQIPSGSNICNYSVCP